MGKAVNMQPTPLFVFKVVDTSTSKNIRSTFARLYCERELGHVIGPRRIVKINLARTTMACGVRKVYLR